MRDFRGGDATVIVWKMDFVRVAIVDSGCSSDIHPIDFVLAKFPKKIRDLIQSIQFDTDVAPIICEKGATVKHGIFGHLFGCMLAPWLSFLYFSRTAGNGGRYALLLDLWTSTLYGYC